jgi:hypothetical protein
MGQTGNMRTGMTGLSGGGWQTLLLSSLDERIGPAVPIAGFSSLTTAIEHPEYAGDAEQNAPDMRATVDYASLMALRAPRPTLLIYNAMDDCCFRAGVVKQGVFDDIEPYYAASGNAAQLHWYVNEDPGTHNYQLDSREQSYHFFADAFHLGIAPREEDDTDKEVRSEDELNVGISDKNLTIVGLARKLAVQIDHTPSANQDATAQEKQLEQVVRFTGVSVQHAWLISATHEKGIESRGYRFEFSNGLSATGVMLFSYQHPASAKSFVIVMADDGRKGLAVEAGNAVARGETVLVFNPIFTGDNIPGAPEHSQLTNMAQMVNTVGERPLGLQAAQLIAVTRWMQLGEFDGTSTPGSIAAHPTSTAKVRMETTGPRTQTIASVSAALKPELFSALDSHRSMTSLGEVFRTP